MARAEAIFAAGCFWGVEHTFRAADGVLETAVGYTGGATENPTYEQVCTGRTGHAEAVKVVFDDSKISFEALLDIFWKCHDPTQLNYQGPDHGTQYRTGVFYLDSAQKDAAVASKAALEASGSAGAPVVTEITKAGPFYMAEDYHQQYFEKRGRGFGGLFGH